MMLSIAFTECTREICVAFLMNRRAEEFKTHLMSLYNQVSIRVSLASRAFHPRRYYTLIKMACLPFCGFVSLGLRLQYKVWVPYEIVTKKNVDFASGADFLNRLAAFVKEKFR